MLEREERSTFTCTEVLQREEKITAHHAECLRKDAGKSTDDTIRERLQSVFQESVQAEGKYWFCQVS